MSGPLAIAGVTAVLRDLLNNGLVDHNVSGGLGSNVIVTASPPDTIPIDKDIVQTQLNLFLHQVTPNPGWRNAALPSRDAYGARLSNPPLALDLHYVLTAYGPEDLHAEILLGYAMQLLHETPVFDRQAIRTALAGGTVSGTVLPPAFQSANAVDLADQVEQIKVSPTTLSTEEMSRLWSALQAHYRPSAAYLVSVVLIEAARRTRAVLPVLQRRITVEPSLVPPYPTLSTVALLPAGRIAAQLGDAIVLTGHHLDGTNVRVRFEHARLEAPIDRVPEDGASARRVEVVIPDDAAAEWPPGLWMVSVLVTRPDENHARASNALPMQLAPTLDVAASSVARDADSDAVTVTLAFKPGVRPGQRASLYCGGREAPAEPFTSAASALDFVFPALEAGDQWVRLRVDGADSALVDRGSDPPAFDATQKLAIPA